MPKYKLLKFILLFLFITTAYSQTLNFDQFLEIGKDFLDIEKAAEVKDYFPEKYSITALDIGDFSGDGLNDFSIGIKPFRVNDIIIYFFVYQTGQYQIVLKDTLNFIETPLEVGFTIKGNTCFLTHKIKEKNWEITGFSFEKGKLRVVDYYMTDVYGYNSKRNYGIQEYLNFEGQESFSGYYNVTTLKDIQKFPYIILPAVSWKMNQNKNYEVPIDTAWMLTEKMSLSEKIGKLEVIRYSKYLKFRFSFFHPFLSMLDSSSFQQIYLGLDTNIDRLKEVKKRTLNFREAVDSSIGILALKFNLSQPDSVKMEFSSSLNADIQTLNGLKLTYEKEVTGDLIYNLYIPNSYLNLTSEIEKIGNFILMNFQKKNGGNIILTNVKTSPLIPAGYSRLFISDEKFFYGQNWQNNKN